MTLEQKEMISHDVIVAAHKAAQIAKCSTIEQLAGTVDVTHLEALELLARHFSFSTADAMRMREWEFAVDILPLAKALQKKCPIFRAEGHLVAVIAEPFDLGLQLWVESLISPIEFRLATPADIDAFLATKEADVRAMDSIHVQRDNESTRGKHVEELSLKSITEDTSQIVQIVNSTLYDALRAGASDIHIESQPEGIATRYRVDGVLSRVSFHEGSATAEQVISRLKVLAELDIAEHRVPQDGRFKISALGRSIDFRVSIMPSIHGEDAVLRVLDKHTIIPEGQLLNLDLLGFEAGDLTKIRRLTSQPFGMLLVTGPTGSGKTTTLYAALSEMDLVQDKVVTIEDPVEYELQGVLQIPVNEKKGLSFARGLRSILRHDPDKIMVGEIRDPETAEIAVQSALTGHLVLTTVHANNVFDVFNRFTHMGIDPYALTAALNGIWAQRLIRTICPRCAESYLPSAEDLELAGVAISEIDGATLKQGAGCGECRGTGYRGRRAIAEILTLNDHLREMIARQAPITDIKREAHKGGTRPLRDAALALVKAGETTIKELGRVTLH